MTALLIDADACPVTAAAISIARRRGVSVLLVSNGSQNLARYAGRRGVDTLQVAGGPDAADFAIVGRVEPDDVVLTQDIGLAAMVLGRGARAVSPRGKVFRPETIDAEMALRWAEKEHRRAGGRTRGPDPFTDDDRERFAAALERLLDEARSG
jgi:uncharacterized protein YaiI (UPF0178 family)